MRGAREGAIRGILYTGFACGVAQVLWPLFKRQTIAFKAFLISAVGRPLNLVTGSCALTQSLHRAP